MVTRISRSPEETEAIGAEMAAQAPPGLVVGLVGDLGAGKTQFVKGFVRGRGIRQRIHSPTFTLVNVYDGPVPLFHLDLYRLETPEQVFGAGLEEYLPPREGIALVEWFDRVGGAMQLPNLRLVTLRAIGDDEREISYDDPRT
jgi:tRNA threonylcarbamoyladenosine biosynthesis protein TsaE